MIRRRYVEAMKPPYKGMAATIAGVSRSSARVTHLLASRAPTHNTEHHSHKTHAVFVVGPDPLAICSCNVCTVSIMSAAFYVRNGVGVLVRLGRRVLVLNGTYSGTTVVLCVSDNTVYILVRRTDEAEAEWA